MWQELINQVLLINVINTNTFTSNYLYVISLIYNTYIDNSISMKMMKALCVHRNLEIYLKKIKLKL